MNESHADVDMEQDEDNWLPYEMSDVADMLITFEQDVVTAEESRFNDRDIQWSMLSHVLLNLGGDEQPELYDMLDAVMSKFAAQFKDKMYWRPVTEEACARH